MFAGSFDCRLDRQGRVAIPSAFRRKIEDSGDSFVLTFFDDAIAGYPRGTWLSLEKQVLSLPAFSKKARAVSRVLASRAHESRLDTQGRILVPTALRKLAGLDRDEPAAERKLGLSFHRKAGDHEPAKCEFLHDYLLCLHKAG